MIAAVDHGTAAVGSNREKKVAGKTGTLRDGKANVGLFASYAPADDPQLVVVVITRGPKESGAAAASVAAAIYRALGPLS
jgi:cell division protein FtsI/penicillin-binding protein 2